MVDSFKTFISNQALADEVPFGLDFGIKPPTDLGTPVEIAGYIFPSYNELLGRESWFFEALATKVSAPVTESTMLYRKLGLALLEMLTTKITKQFIWDEILETLITRNEILKKADRASEVTPLPAKGASIEEIQAALTISHAVYFITAPPISLASSREYLEYEQTQTEDLQELLAILKLGQSTQSVTWVKVTFFMLSRVDGEWTFEKTGALRESQLKAISDFITLETNRGIEPSALTTGNTDATEDDADGGKGSSAKPQSVKSTGTSKKPD